MGQKGQAVFGRKVACATNILSRRLRLGQVLADCDSCNGIPAFWILFDDRSHHDDCTLRS